MRIIHCADVHLDARMNTHFNREQSKERRNEILLSFLRMLDYAREEEIDAILIAGDLFDTSQVSTATRRAVIDGIRSIKHTEVFYLQGNHDMSQFFSDLGRLPDNLHLFGREWSSYRLGRVVISGLELSSNNQASCHETLHLKEEDINLVMLHGQESKYLTRKQAIYQTELVPLNALANKYIDYLALGHIHSYKRESLDARGIYCYSGCLEGRGFDECGPKGFVMLEIDEKMGSIKDTFVPFAKRFLYSLEVDCSGVETTTEAFTRIVEVLRQEAIEEAGMVKLTLTGEVDVECQLDEKYLLQGLSMDYYFVKLVNQTGIFIDYRDYEKEQSLKGEFVRQVQNSNLSEEEKLKVLKMGIMALKGEALD